MSEGKRASIEEIQFAGEPPATGPIKSMNSKVSSTLVSLLLLTAAATFAAAPAGTTPVGRDGKPLNLDFEDGTLKDWKAEGKAFDR